MTIRGLKMQAENQAQILEFHRLQSKPGIRAVFAENSIYNAIEALHEATEAGYVVDRIFLRDSIQQLLNIEHRIYCMQELTGVMGKAAQ